MMQMERNHLFQIMRWQRHLNQHCRQGSWKEIAESISKCDELLDETIDGNAERVAEIIELAHETYTSILKYNDENALSCVLTMAYFTAPAYYNVIREMPSGKGFADFVFLPRANAGNRPAMIVELKYNQSADNKHSSRLKKNDYQGSFVWISRKDSLSWNQIMTQKNIIPV